MKMKVLNIYLVAFLLAVFFLSCSKDESGSMEVISNGGKGGSMARFAIAGNRLYTVDNERINVFDIAQPAQPTALNSTLAGWGIETIFPYQGNLFLGTSNGMLVYSISDPNSVRFVSRIDHFTTCDPVVVEGNYAYLTLRTESWCGRNTNELQIINISDLENPMVETVYEMKKPYGLGIDGSELFICDDGLKVYDASNIFDLKLKHHFDIDARDVIPYNGLLIVIGTDGLHQYSYINGNIQKLSTLASFN